MCRRLPPGSRERRRARPRSRRSSCVLEPEVAHRVGPSCARRQVVQDDASRPARAAPTSLRRRPSPPPSKKRRSNGASGGSSSRQSPCEHAHVLVRGEERGRGRRALGVELDRDERHLRGSAETIHAAPTPAPVPISPTRARPRWRREHVQQAADLGLARAPEPVLARRAPARTRRAAAGAPTLSWPRAAHPAAFRPRAGRRGLARPVRGARAEAEGWAREHGLAPAGGRPVPRRPRRRRRPEHVLHARLRALRRRPLGHRRRRRQPPPLRVRLPQPRHDHADRPDPGHAPGDADLPRVLLVDEDGRHPEPYTLVSADDVEAGRWRIDPAAAGGARPRPEDAAEHLRHYTRPLEEGGKYSLTIWPYHAMLGGIGHALVSARRGGDLLPLGRPPRSTLPDQGPGPAHRALLGARPGGEFDPDGEPLGHSATCRSIERLLGFDAVVVAGQAKSHCVAWTIADLLSDLRHDASSRRRSTCSRTARRPSSSRAGRLHRRGRRGVRPLRRGGHARRPLDRPDRVAGRGCRRRVVSTAAWL